MTAFLKRKKKLLTGNFVSRSPFCFSNWLAYSLLASTKKLFASFSRITISSWIVCSGARGGGGGGRGGARGGGGRGRGGGGG
ncbi:hypothetical protein PP707_00485, partial [Acetobacter pasteurianus]|nr:hypothetical protein [Acetobacter pasteurianus]